MMRKVQKVKVIVCVRVSILANVSQLLRSQVYHSDRFKKSNIKKINSHHKVLKYLVNFIQSRSYNPGTTRYVSFLYELFI